MSNEMLNKTHVGDCRDILALAAYKRVKIQTCVTSPPYFGLRDYGHAEQIGLESTPSEYVLRLVEVFRAVRDVLADDGTAWLNLGDSYAGSLGAQSHRESSTNDDRLSADSIKNHPKRQSHTGTIREAGLKQKDLMGIPWRVAFALQADGWYLRQDIIWHKPNPMPESVNDRCTKAHEYIFLLSKSPRYYFDSDAIKEPSVNAGKRVKLGEKSFAKGQADGAKVARSGNGNAEFYDVKTMRNRRSVWSIPPANFRGAHFATFPPDLVRPCILAGSKPGDTVLDPFMGSGTVAQIAKENGRNYLGCELNTEYIKLHVLRGL